MEVSVPACPRCGSANTKFCYYNNYSLTQPRYFCKGCRRYWTKGGSLRNVPVGGGCRKSRRGRPVRMDRNPARDWAEKPGPIPSQPEASTSNCNIDIAAVYANFLNQSPCPRIEAVSEGIVIPPIEFSHFPVGSLPPANGYFECGVSAAETQMFGPGSGVSMFSGGLDGLQNSFMSVNPIMGNDLLPPLPGEEMWPDSDVVLRNQILDSGREVRAEVEPGEQNAEVVDGNMGPFCGLNLEAFFRS